MLEDISSLFVSFLFPLQANATANKFLKKKLKNKEKTKSRSQTENILKISRLKIGMDFRISCKDT